MGKKKLSSTAGADRCPCGSGLMYQACCARYHQGQNSPSAEALMRSRYSAYALGLDDYVLSTWAPETRPSQLFTPDEARPKWIGLSVLGSSEQGDRATVDFVARARTAQGAIKLAEHSRFERIEGRWYYVDGDELTQR